VSVVRRNVIANIAGGGWNLLMSLAFVPVYIHFLGIEAYGLIGMFLALVAILSLLDLGLGTTLNRELARLSVETGSAQRMRDLLRTLEVMYWTIGLLIGLGLVGLAPVIAAYWVKAQQLPQESVERAFLLMGIALASQWPQVLYNGGLLGLQRQVLLNTLSALMATVRNVGAALVLWKISGTIEAFLAWQVLINLVLTFVVAIALWRALPSGTTSARFRLHQLGEVWRFAAGMTSISVMTVVLTQLDKVILSRVLSLEAFGYYSLAWRVASGIYYLVGPVNAAFFPRFSQLAALDDQRELERLYHRGCQLITVLVVPVAIVLALFPENVLLLWQIETNIAAKTSTVLALLTVGTAINGLMILPVSVQYAHGWARLAFLTNAVAVTVLAPVIYLAALHYGVVGAAWVWIILNSGYVAVIMPLMHRRLLRGRLRNWLAGDVGAPLVAALLVCGIVKFSIDLPGPALWQLLYLGGAFALTLVAAVLAAPQVRTLVLWRRLRQPDAGPAP
jgi:O-antigen/teichoic acid export membrane protein